MKILGKINWVGVLAVLLLIGGYALGQSGRVEAGTILLLIVLVMAIAATSDGFNGWIQRLARTIKAILSGDMP